MPPVAPEPAPKWPVYAGVALAALVLAAAVMYARRRKRSLPASAPPPAAPHEIALRGLDALERHDAERVCESVSAILRAYIAARFGVCAPEAATDELLERLFAACHFEPPNRHKLQSLFAACDLVKYAGLRPSAAEVLRLVDGSREWVSATRLEILSTDATVLFR